jgi:sulfur carrier protein ThiS
MTVQVNGQPVEIFNGARVQDALRRYSETEYHLVSAGEKMVVDHRGDRVYLDGALSDGDVLLVKNISRGVP